MTVTWDPFKRSLHTTLSGGNLTATGSINRTVGVAVDISNKLVWFRNAQTNRWNASDTADPASGTGGISFTPASGLFPAASVDPGASQTISVTGAFAAASMQWPIPAGFSAWDTLAGSATTWNPSDKNAAITLTGSNLIASNTGSASYVAVRATNSLSSGKAYWEFTWSAFTGAFASSFSGVGLGTSAMSLSNFVGASSASSFSINCTGGINGATGSGDTSAYLTATAFYSSVLSTQSRSSGKYYFEATVGALESGTGWLLGLCDGAAVNFSNATAPSYTTHGYQFNVQNAGAGNVFYNGVAVQAADIITHAAKTVGVAVDFGAKLIWFWSNDGVNRWNKSGTANPATGVGGFDISALLGVSPAQFPTISPHAHDSSLSAATNFGATAFVNTLPSGFSSWDGSQTPLVPVELAGNLGGVSHYGKLKYGLGHYSRISPFAPVFAADLTIAPVLDLSGALAPIIILAADLDVHVNLIELSGGIAPQIALGGSLSLDLSLTALEGSFGFTVVLGASSFVSGPLWADSEPCPSPPWGPSEPCPPSMWTPVGPCDPVMWKKSELCNG